MSITIPDLFIIFKISNRTVPIDNDLRCIIIWLREYKYCYNTFVTYRVIVLRFYLWLKYNGLTLKTINKYYLLSYSEFIKAPDPDWCNIHRKKFSDPDWKPFQKSLSNKSVYSNLLVIKSMFKYLFHSNMLEYNPFFFKIKNDSITYNSLVKQSKYLTEAEFQYIIDFIEKIPNSSLKIKDGKVRILWIFKLLFYTGCRRSEIVNSSMNDIKVINRRIWLQVIGKGNKVGLIPIPTELAIALNEYRNYYGLPSIHNRNSNEINIPLIILHKSNNQFSPISSSHLWYIVKSVCLLIAETTTNPILKAKLDKTSPHWFRHSAATAQIDQGINIKIVQQNLRHTSIETTMKYLHLDNDLRHQATINFGSKSKT